MSGGPGAGRAPLLVIAAGGTGGHMFPAQALAEAMLARGWRVRLSTDARGARYTGNFPAGCEITQVASATFARGGALAKLAVPLRIAGGVAKAKWRFLADRPAAVVGFGGYPSIPALVAAWALRIPRMIHEQNGVLGRVNTVFATRVHKVACGTWPTTLPKGVVAEHTGNPVRGAIRAAAGAPYPDGGRVHLLVVGGSQGASVMRLVPEAVALLPDGTRALLDVSQQAREADAEAVQAAYAALNVACEVRPFFDDMPKRLSSAHLVISRAGASSVADISVIGRPSILVPFAAATGDHQTANARGLAEAGAAVVIQEADLTPQVLSDEIARILTTPDAATDMAQAALDAGRPDATERLVALVEELAQNPATAQTGDRR